MPSPTLSKTPAEVIHTALAAERDARALLDARQVDGCDRLVHALGAATAGLLAAQQFRLRGVSTPHAGIARWRRYVDEVRAALGSADPAAARVPEPPRLMSARLWLELGRARAGR